MANNHKAPLIRQAQLRRSTGSMLSMTGMIAGILLFTLMIGFGLYLLLVQQKRGQNLDDTFTLAIADSLNKDDKIGQMNNVVARSRELVFVSRQNSDIANSLPEGVYQPLANQLLDEARASAQFVDAERKNEIKYITKTTRAMVDDYNAHRHVDSSFTLPWFKTYDPKVQDVYFGHIKKVQSNVINMDVIPELRDFDALKQYFEPGSQLYKGNINAKLPNPDNDLDFKISSLPADVDKTVAPARLTNPEVFLRDAPVFEGEKFVGRDCDQLPSSIEIIEGMDLEIKNDAHKVRIGSTATTNGALPAP